MGDLLGRQIDCLGTSYIFLLNLIKGHNSLGDSLPFKKNSFCFIVGLEPHGILVPRPGVEPVPSAVEEQRLNHWTPREVQITSLLNLVKSHDDPLIWIV